MSRSDVVRRFSAAREKVAALLERYPWLEEASDAALVWLYWYNYDAKELGVRLPFIPKRVLNQLTNPETIIRRRRELGVRKEAGVVA